MDCQRIDATRIDDLWELQKMYKSEIGETEPRDEEKTLLAKAIAENKIIFYGAWDEKALVGCCSVTMVFSTFHYKPCGVFEDFFIRPEYRHRGIARQLVRYAYRESSVDSLTVGCADCDVEMYQALGFSIPLGNLMALKE